MRELGANVGLTSLGSGKLNENCGASDTSDLMTGICLKRGSTVLEVSGD